MKASFDKLRMSGFYTLSFTLSLSKGATLIISLWLTQYATAIEPTEKSEPVVSINLCTDQWLILFQDKHTSYYFSPLALNKGYNYLYSQVKKTQVILPSLDALILLNPSLILASQYSDKNLIHGLNNFGLSFAIIEPVTNFEGIRRNISRIGKLINKMDKANLLLHDFNKRLTIVAKDAKNRPNQTAIFYAPNGFTHGEGTIYNAILEASGLTNLATELGVKGHGYLSLETLLWNNPDIIILEDDFSNNDSLSQQMLKHPALNRLLNQSRLIFVNANKLSCAGFGSLLAAEQIMEQR